MKKIQHFLIASLTILFIWACGSNYNSVKSTEKEEPVVIANDSLEYEIIIIDPGFNYYLNAIAQPRGHYNQNYMEARNRAWVLEWNQRFRNPQRFNALIYENEIDYRSSIDYGYEVNYLLFNYFLFAQQKYKMNLGGGFRTNRIN